MGKKYISHVAKLEHSMPPKLFPEFGDEPLRLAIMGDTREHNDWCKENCEGGRD